MNITFEEQQLMSLYNTGTRAGLIAALEEMRGYLAAMKRSCGSWRTAPSQSCAG